MTRSYLSPSQELRAQQIVAAHTHVKRLEEATATAIKYHDKYLAAVETVMTCLLDSADTWLDVRTHLGPEAVTAMDAIAPSSSRLAAAYNTWKVSKELHVLRDELAALKDLSKAGHSHTKTAKTHVEELTKAAKKCADVNGAEYESKIAQRSGKAKEKLLKEQRGANAKVAALDRTVVNDLKSTGTWWSARLVSHCDDLYDAFAKLGSRTLACFSDGAPAQPSRSATQQISSNRLMNGSGAGPATGGAVGGIGYPASVSPAGPYNPATTASGVPLQFESVARNVTAL